MRFQAAAQDGRAVVYAAIQADPLVARAADLLVGASAGERILARAVMNGERSDASVWRRIFPTLFGAVGSVTSADISDGSTTGAQAVLAVALEVADRGDEIRNQLRGAIVEAVTERLLARRSPPAAVRRERRILFDGVAAEIHPFDVTVELAGRAEAWDCKWGARGIGADVLYQLDGARGNAADEDERLTAGLVVFDADRSCRVRLERQTAPHDEIRLVSLETLDALAGEPAR